MGMRVRKQNENASALAQALNNNPHVKAVYHPSLADHPQHVLASKLLKDGYGAILSFRITDSREKVNGFMHQLKLAKYLGTLGGIRTTLSYPLLSSHMHVPEEDLKKMNISGGLMRVSTGIENADDLIKDFTQALEVFDD